MVSQSNSVLVFPTHSGMCKVVTKRHQLFAKTFQLNYISPKLELKTINHLLCERKFLAHFKAFIA